MKRIFRISSLTISAILLLAVSAVYAETEPDEGYDQNIEVSFTGSVSEISETAPVMHGRRGSMMGRGLRTAVMLTVKSAHRTYHVIAGPAWFMKKNNFTVSQGDEVKITGAKLFGRDGNLYIITKQISVTSTGATLVLRDSFGRPVWRRHSQ